MFAIDSAESCISAAIAGSDYAGRLLPFMDDYVEISMMFHDRCPKTHKRMDEPGRDVLETARIFNHLVLGCPLSGLSSFKFTSTLERCRRKVKGQLFMTRMIMGAKNEQSNCNDEENHRQPCMCKPLRLAELAHFEDDREFKTQQGRIE
jgi:hypothetical protein